MTSGFSGRQALGRIAEAYAIQVLVFARSFPHNARLVRRQRAAHRNHARALPCREAASCKALEETLGTFIETVRQLRWRGSAATTVPPTHGSHYFLELLSGHEGEQRRSTLALGRVQNRITNGAEEDVWHYYQVLVADHGVQGPAVAPAPESPPKASSATARHSSQRTGHARRCSRDAIASVVCPKLRAQQLSPTGPTIHL